MIFHRPPVFMTGSGKIAGSLWEINGSAQTEVSSLPFKKQLQLTLRNILEPDSFSYSQGKQLMFPFKK